MKLGALIMSTTALAALCSAAEKDGRGDQGSGDPTVLSRAAAGVPPRVGVLSYCPNTQPQYQPINATNTLVSDGRFGSVTLVSASNTLPAAETLKSSFDCVVAITDLGCGVPMPDFIADSAAGALADFARSGKGVVLTSFSFAQPRPSLGLGSAIFAAGLSPLQGLSIFNVSPGGVNTAAMSTAPECAEITQGVTGSLNSTFANYTIPSDGARVCASYYSGLPAVAVNGAGNVVGFNSFPSSAADESQASYRRLFANSVYRACTAGPAAVTVPVDIKPASCPNVVPIQSKGVLPVAIAGTQDVPVSQIDPTSIRLAGIPPLRSSLADVAAPYAPSTGKTSCGACNSSTGDGILDLELKFDMELLAETLPGGQGEACVVLKLTGKLKAEFGGAPITGEDVVTIKRK